MMDYLDKDEERKKLLDPKAPYEAPAVLRVFNTGLRGSALCEALGLQPREAVDKLHLAMEERDAASHAGRRITEFTVPKTAR